MIKGKNSQNTTKKNSSFNITTKKENKTKKILIFAILGLLLLVSFVVNIWPIRTAFWWDETVYLQNAEVIHSGKVNYNELQFRPPLLSILFAGAYIFYHNILSAEIIVALLASMGTLFMFFIGKELYGNKTGLIAAILFAFSPFLVENAHYIMTDVPAAALIACALYLMIIALKKDNWIYYALSGFVFSLSVLMKFTSIVILFIIPLYFLVQRIRISKGYPLVAGFLIGITPYLIWAQITKGFFLKPFLLAQNMVADTNEHLFFYFNNFFSIFPYIVGVGLLVFVITGIIIHRNKNKSKKSNHENNTNSIYKTNSSYNNNKIVNKHNGINNKNINADNIFFVIWILVFLAYITLTNHKELRYAIPLTIPLLLLASTGLVSLTETKNRFRNYVILGIIAIIVVLSIYSSFEKISTPFQNTYSTEEMQVSQYIKSEYPTNTIIYSNDNYPVFAYYTGMRVIKLEHQDETFYNTYKSEMKYDGLLIIYKDKKQPTSNWLGNNTKFALKKEFQTALLYEYKI